jgi:anti-anti-sigma regulatory factor
VINFGSVETINTIGISILVGIIEKVLQHRGIVYFTHLTGTSREIFEVLNLNTVAMIFEDDGAAMEHIERDRNSLRRAMDA